jgi:hypothetical protein
VLGGVVFYSGEQTVDVVGGWRDLLEHPPDGLTNTVSLTTAPPAPFIPEVWHGKKLASVIVCCSGEVGEGEDVVQPFRTLTTPIADLLGPTPYVDLQQMVGPLWEAGAANYFTSAFLDRLPDEAIATLSDYQQRSADRSVQAELHIHQLGGAFGRVPTGHTAFTDRSATFLVNCTTGIADPDDLPPHAAWAWAVRDEMAVHGKGARYASFAGEGGDDNVRSSYPYDVLVRLQAVRNQYDPFNMFRFNLNISPTTSVVRPDMPGSLGRITCSLPTTPIIHPSTAVWSRSRLTSAGPRRRWSGHHVRDRPTGWRPGRLRCVSDPTDYRRLEERGTVGLGGTSLQTETARQTHEVEGR